MKNNYRPLAKKIKGTDYDIWSPTLRSNLTKGVGLKLFQRFFMETMISCVKDADRGYDVLVQHLGEEKAKKAIDEKIREAAIPEDIDEFSDRVRAEFLDIFPVRFFVANWEKSLDDASGHDKILFQMREAFSRDNWRATGGGVFIAGD